MYMRKAPPTREGPFPMKKTLHFKLIFPAGGRIIKAEPAGNHRKGANQMKDTDATGNYYNIRAVAMITGLTDRTIRNYISLGLLQGEKINGLWHFTPEQVEAFLRHPAVRPSIQAKKNAIVYDFLLESRRREPEACMILDLPGCDQKETAEFFCYAINSGKEFYNLRFSMDTVNETPRIILKGPTHQILALVNQYYRR